MKRLVLIGALMCTTPALAQLAPSEPAPRPLPPDSFQWDGNRKGLKDFEPPTPVTIDGKMPLPAARNTPPTPPPPRPEQEKKPAKSVG
jgi:hypothetical protein